MPKIHKADVPGRPIISGCNGPTARLSEYADHFLKPLMNHIKSYVKDSMIFLRRIFSLNDKLPDNTILLTIDVKSLCTNIPNDEGIKASMEVLEKHNTQNYGDINVIRQTLKLILNNNYFEFNGKYYLQTHGTAMGTPVAPSYANLFMAALEEQLLLNAPNGLIPFEWIRFIDDIFAIWPHGTNSLMTFFNYINNFHPTIKFDYEYSESSVHFLDTTIFISDKANWNPIYT